MMTQDQIDRFSAIKRQAWIASLCLSWAVGMCGCSSIKVGVGARVPLDKTTVTSMTAKLANGSGIAPGQNAALIVELMRPDGKILVTEGKGGGKVRWKDLEVVARIVDVNQKGIVSLSEDPRFSEGKTGHVTITASSHPNLRAEFDIPIRYDATYIANFSGANGTDGMNGMDGMNGISGSSGSMDPSNQHPAATEEMERMAPTEKTEIPAEMRLTCC
jgi:hypothetical protein